MSELKQSVKKVFSGSLESFRDFPATIVFAFVFLIITLIKIQLDWQQQEPYNFVLNCLQWSLALGAIFSLMTTTWVYSRSNNKRDFLIANILGIVIVALTFVILYFFAGSTPQYRDSRYQVISSLATARVSVGILVSYLTFITLSSLDFGKALFMNLKAFFVALIYGLVIMGGASGVAGAIQALLYQDMSSKVYMYIGAITGFLAFTLFVGYFPDFRLGKYDGQREEAEKQPRFVEILFGYIMVPLMIALTLVLLLWIGRTVLTGIDVPFGDLAGITAAYTIGGVWLHMMVSGHDTKVTKFYIRFYPIAALVILVFAVIALIQQLSETGLRSGEYWFILTWLVAVIGAVLMIILKSKSYNIIVAITCLLAVLSVSPIVGYNVLPVKSQVNRLEKLLIKENMIKDDTIVPAEEEPAIEVRVAITEAVDYLSYQNDANLPAWFDKDLINYNHFSEVFGFEEVWTDINYEGQPSEYKGINLYLPVGSIDISEYKFAINLRDQFEKGSAFTTAEGEKGTYKIYWESNYGNSIPYLEIQLNDEIIIEKHMGEYIDEISQKYGYESGESKPASLEDMTMVLESEEVKLLLLFRNLEINKDTNNDYTYYNIYLESIYILEK